MQRHDWMSTCEHIYATMMLGFLKTICTVVSRIRCWPGCGSVPWVPYIYMQSKHHLPHADISCVVSCSVPAISTHPWVLQGRQEVNSSTSNQQPGVKTNPGS